MSTEPTQADPRAIRAITLSDGPVTLALQMVHKEWEAHNGGDPDFLLVPADRVRDLREEMRLALRSELPCVDDIKRDACTGKLVIGGFPVYVGTRYGAGVYA